MKTLALLGATALLAACSDRLPVANNVTAVEVNGIEEVMPSEGEPTADANAAVTASSDGYLGRWIGVEGTYLEISARPGGGVVMDMQWDLDNHGEYEGSVMPEGVRFMRGGVAHVARRTDGDATGLKYLAGKKDCLTVKSGEGYCRD